MLDLIVQYIESDIFSKLLMMFACCQMGGEMLQYSLGFVKKFKLFSQSNVCLLYVSWL